MASPAAATTAPADAAPAAFNFKAILQEMVKQNASDLHLKVGRPPTLRVQGELSPLQHAAMRPEDLKSLAEQVMSPRQVKEFAENKEADFAIGVPGIGRFRVNVYQQRGTIAYRVALHPLSDEHGRGAAICPRSSSRSRCGRAAWCW